MTRKKRFYLFFLILLSGFACTPEKQEKPTQPITPAIQQDDTIVSPAETTPKAGIKEDYTNTNRMIWQKPEMVINLLGDLTNKTVADIGAGKSGFFTMPLVPKAEKVIAIDIFPDIIESLDSVKTFRLTEDLQQKLEIRLAKEDNPLLENEEVDVALIVNTYIYFEDRMNYLRTLKKGIKSGGKLLIIDFKRKRTELKNGASKNKRIGPPYELRVPLYQVEEELEQAGFVNLESNDTALDYQYIVVCEKP